MGFAIGIVRLALSGGGDLGWLALRAAIRASCSTNFASNSLRVRRVIAEGVLWAVQALAGTEDCLAETVRFDMRSGIAIFVGAFFILCLTNTLLFWAFTFFFEAGHT